MNKKQHHFHALSARHFVTVIEGRTLHMEIVSAEMSPMMIDATAADFSGIGWF